MECIILSVKDTYMDAQEVMHMTDYSKITALYSRLSVGDEDRDGGESNSIQKTFSSPCACAWNIWEAFLRLSCLTT